MPALPPRLLAVLSLLLATTIWGTVFVITKSVLDDVPPLLFAFLRNGIAAAFLLPLAFQESRKNQSTTLRPWRTVVLMALTGITLHFMGQTLSLQYTTASAAALIQGTIPALTAIASVVMLGEQLGRARGVGIGASILGVILIVLAGGGADGGSQPILGNLLMLGACICWAVYTVLAKRMAYAPQTLLTAYVTLLGTVMLMPGAAYDWSANAPITLTRDTWLAALYLGIFASGLNLLLWNRALQHLDATVAGNFINLVPVIGVAAAALFLQEQPTLIQWLGGFLVLVGIGISVRSSPNLASAPAN